MTEDERINLLITFFEQERDYAKETLSSGSHSSIGSLMLNKRIAWFDTLIATIKGAKTEEGIKELKAAIEKEKKRKEGVKK